MSSPEAKATSSPNSPPPAQKSSAPPKQESMLVNLGFNVIVPTLILTKLSGDEYLGTTWGVVVALLFPIIYGLRDFQQRGKINFFSGLGVFSVVMTGGISLLELDPQYLAYKEAGIPAIFGLATLISLKTPYPLVRTLLFNDTVIEIDKVHHALVEHNSVEAFDRRLITASCIIAASFLISSILNYLLATMIVTSQPGTVEYNAELGKMTALSFPVIALPAMIMMMGAMFYLFRGITRMTGMPFEDIIRTHHETTNESDDNNKDKQ
ncbi:MAG: VC0807 family protein [Candidatus Reddybacter sp.]